MSPIPTVFYLLKNNFIALRGNKIFVVVSLVDPIFVNCIAFHQYSLTDVSSSFIISVTSRDAFGGFPFAALSAKIITVVAEVRL